MPKIRELFTIKRHRYYISLYFLGEFKGNYDNDQEVEEAEREILGY
jgi:hypothetical protein